MYNYINFVIDNSASAYFTDNKSHFIRKSNIASAALTFPLPCTSVSSLHF